MDPSTITSLVSRCTAIAHRVGWILVDLKDLEKRYVDVEVGITSLTSHLGNIRAMINRLSQRVEKGAVQTFELEKQFRSSLEACDLVIETIQSQVARALSSATPGLFKFGRKRKHLWDEGTVKEHQKQLNSQLQCLSIFIRAVQLSPIDQAAALRSQDTTAILTEARDDAAVFSGKPKSSAGRPDSAISMSSVYLNNNGAASNPHKGPLHALMRTRSTHQRNLSAIPERSVISEVDEELQDPKPNGTDGSRNSAARNHFKRWASSSKYQTNEPHALSVREDNRPQQGVPQNFNDPGFRNTPSPTPPDEEFGVDDLALSRPSSSYTLTEVDG
ncbi:uncharacterized protein BDZ99DRAFT_458048 [Mytilinidion resinicola]|uniref:Fungal N-terminal domain-containing protein n=1 Tax=Mytilinidion resinicola TaxID=574789 RepID=A0A6A6Z4T4_9PEZI|nr:uncharacterized protein BDZ99DRAFT_458048 [Mytilinidion resinicola]KAF2816151.1 hypothetical protein BDZ99DRAFT_458048 [Mytilinidion resinicola]